VVQKASLVRIFSAEQARAARKDAQLTRLQSSVRRLPLADALDAWDQAGIRERQELARIVFPKVVSWR
jgi:hypothetical protein